MDHDREIGVLGAGIGCAPARINDVNLIEFLARECDVVGTIANKVTLLQDGCAAINKHVMSEIVCNDGKHLRPAMLYDGTIRKQEPEWHACGLRASELICDPQTPANTGANW